MSSFPVIPGYKIEKKIGQSRIAEVYLGVQEDLDRKVGIKVLNSELFHSKSLVERFLKEAKKDAKFVHSNIANILEVGETHGIRYIVMEYLPESLRDIIKRQFGKGEIQEESMVIERGSADFTMDSTKNKKLSERELVDIIKQIARALDYAHKNGVIHRNIRPENIRFREDGTATIVDFFISKVLDGKTREVLKDRGITIGSPHYASPEQALRKSLDGRTDIYNLGIVFFEMLTGHVPYDAEETIAIENQHIMEPVPQLPEKYKKYQSLLDRMMTKDPEERIASGAGVIQFLEQASNDFLSTWQSSSPRMESPSTSDFGMDNGLPLEEIPPMKEFDSMEDNLSDEDISNLREKTLDDDELDVDSFELEDQINSLEKKINKSGSSIYKSNSKQGFFAKLSEPKVMIPIGVAIVALIFIMVFVIKPFSAGDSGVGQGQAGETAYSRALSKEEQEKIDIKFFHQLQLAKRFYGSGSYDKAQEKIEEAESYKSTSESQKLAKQINEKIAEQKDNNAYKAALSAGVSTAVEEYLKQYPSGIHLKEAEEKLGILKKEEQKKEAERKRILAAMIRLRSKSVTLNREDVKNMLINRGFFEKYYNKTGNFKNHYVPKMVGKDKIIVDFATGLIWHPEGSGNYMKFDAAQQWITELNQQEYAGRKDWHLPTLEEAASLLKNTESSGGLFIDSVFSREQRFIWTCDTNEEGKAWVIDFFSGDTSPIELNTNVFVRPVCKLD